MDLVAVKRILALSQVNQPLERHTEAFLDLCHCVHYVDDCLCVLFRTILNMETRADLLGNESLGTFMEYVEWVLLQNGSSFIICKSKEEMAHHCHQPSNDKS